MITQTVVHGGEASRREQATYACLAEKERRSGSGRTVQTYSRKLLHVIGALGKPKSRWSSPWTKACRDKRKVGRPERENSG